MGGLVEEEVEEKKGGRGEVRGSSIVRVLSGGGELEGVGGFEREKD